MAGDIKPNNLLDLNRSLVKQEDKVSLKSTYFRFLGINLDQYQNVDFTPEEADRVRSHMSHLATGASAVLPLICPGEKKCPFADRCVFVQVDKQRMKDYREAKKSLSGDRLINLELPQLSTPVGRACLIEVNLLKEWTMFYIAEFDVSENSFIELNTCQELAEIEVMLWRLNNNLAKIENVDMTQEDIVGSDRNGNPLTRKSENVLILVKERLQNRKIKLTKSMVGDRQEKYKREAALKTREDKDPSSTAAQLRHDITNMVKQVEKKVLALKEAEGNVIEIDGKDTSPVAVEKEKIVTPDSMIDDLIKGE